MKTRLPAIFMLATILVIASALSIALGDERPADTASNTSAGVQLSKHVESIGQIGGQSYGVAVSGTLAYIGLGPRLAILDITNPVQPLFVGQTGVLPGLVQTVAVAGNFAYTSSGADLYVINISNPVAPIAIGIYHAPAPIWESTVMGSYVYLADWTSGLRIIDVSDPTTPIEVGFYATQGSARGVAAADGYVYLTDTYWANSASGELYIISVTDPTAPVLSGSYHVPVYAEDVAIRGYYAYVATDDGLRIIDVSNPSAPVQVTHYAWLTCCAQNIVVAGNYAYLIYENNGVDIVDISAPAAAVHAGYYVRPTSPTGMAPDPGLAVSGEYAYMPDSRGKLHVVNVSNPTMLIEVGSYMMLGAVNAVGKADDYVYTIDWASRISVIDVSEPATPVKVSSIPIYAEDMVVVGNTIYLANGQLRIIDVSNPMTPTIIGSYDTPGHAYDVVVAGDYAYVADGYTGLSVINVSNPSTPVKVSTYDTPNDAIGIAVAGRYAYVADVHVTYKPPHDPNTFTLHIIDVSNPISPTEAGSFSFIIGDSGYRWDLAVVGNYAYVVEPDGGGGRLRIIDVSNPTVPSQVTQYDLPGQPWKISVIRNYAYIADTGSGLRILDVSQPAAPFEAGSYNAPGGAFGVAVNDNYVYLANSGGGLAILRFTPVVTGSIPISGGVLTSLHDGTIYTFSANTFTNTVNITHSLYLLNDTSLASDNLIGINHFFEVTAVDSDSGQPAQPLQPYTITVQYTENERYPAIENTLAAYWWDGSEWLKEPSSVVDISANTVTVTPNHFSRWAILGETWRIFLPRTAK